MAFREKRLKTHNTTGSMSGNVETNLAVPEGWGTPTVNTAPTTMTGDEIFATRDNPLPAPSEGPLVVGATYYGKLYDGRGFRGIWTTSDTLFCVLPWNGARVARENGVWRTL